MSNVNGFPDSRLRGNDKEGGNDKGDENYKGVGMTNWEMTGDIIRFSYQPVFLYDKISRG
jgi:hypothetical protein